MKNAEQRLAEAIRVVFELDVDPSELEGPAAWLLASIRRGESELALRQEIGKMQSKLSNRVNDADCRQLVEIARRVAQDA